MGAFTTALQTLCSVFDVNYWFQVSEVEACQSVGWVGSFGIAPCVICEDRAWT